MISKKRYVYLLLFVCAFSLKADAPENNFDRNTALMRNVASLYLGFKTEKCQGDKECLQNALRQLRHTHAAIALYLEENDSNEQFAHDKDEFTTLKDALKERALQVNQVIAELELQAEIEEVKESVLKGSDSFNRHVNKNYDDMKAFLDANLDNQ